MTSEQMRAKALEGFFVRDAERNLVYCPQGKILRQKSIKRNGNIRYCNKLACKKCKCKCTISKFKEADFSKDDLIKAISTHRREDASNDGNANLKPPRTTVVKRWYAMCCILTKRKWIITNACQNIRSEQSKGRLETTIFY